MTDNSQYLSSIPCNGFACNICGRILAKGELAFVCPSCGAVLCENCVNNGSLEGHACED